MKAGFNIFFWGKMLNAFFFCLADTIARTRLIAFFGAYRGIGDNGTCTLTGLHLTLRLGWRMGGYSETDRWPSGTYSVPVLPNYRGTFHVTILCLKKIIHLFSNIAIRIFKVLPSVWSVIPPIQWSSEVEGL